jgi:hypothetical protein
MSARICGIKRGGGFLFVVVPIAAMWLFEKLRRKDTEADI